MICPHPICLTNERAECCGSAFSVLSPQSCYRRADGNLIGVGDDFNQGGTFQGEGVFQCGGEVATIGDAPVIRIMFAPLSPRSEQVRLSRRILVIDCRTFMVEKDAHMDREFSMGARLALQILGQRRDIRRRKTALWWHARFCLLLLPLAV